MKGKDLIADHGEDQEKMKNHILTVRKKISNLEEEIPQKQDRLKELKILEKELLEMDLDAYREKHLI